MTSGFGELTQQQQKVLSTIKTLTEARRGRSPSVREIATDVGLSISRTHEHLRAIKAKGHIEIEEGARAIRVVEVSQDQAADRSVHVRFRGRIAAGLGLLAQEEFGEGLRLPRAMIGRYDEDEVFLLEVIGNSMEGAGVYEGDVLVVHQQDRASDGEMVVAQFHSGEQEQSDQEEQELTVKYYHRKRGQWYLVPMAPGFDWIDADNASIKGRVIGLLRVSILRLTRQQLADSESL